MADLAIETKGLTKVFNENTVVAGINLSVEKGTIFGFVGPNGAGKTTTIKMLLGLQTPTSGGGKILGYDIVDESLEIRKRTSFVAETQSMYGYMTVKEIISFTKGMYPHWDDNIVKKFLDLFDLPINRKIKALSKGMRTQLGLVLALGPRPELLILDEPTSGLDPIKQKEFLNTILGQVAETGQTVFFSTHHLWEVERIADMVGIINKGQLIIKSSLDDIKANNKKIKLAIDGQLPDAIKQMPGIIDISNQGKGYIISVNKNADNIINSIEKLSPISMEVINVSLEDIFMDYIGRDNNE